MPSLDIGYLPLRDVALLVMAMMTKEVSEIRIMAARKIAG